MKYLLPVFLISNIFANQFGGFGGFGGLDLDHDPRFKPNRDAGRVSVGECRIRRSGTSYHLNKKNYKLEEVFSLLRTTKSGSELVDEISPLVEAKKLRVSALTSFERQRRGLTSKVAAFYDFTLSTPTIFINFEDELGLVAHFFAHEAYHALDAKIPKEYEVDMVYYNAFKEMEKLFGLDIEPMKPLTEYETQMMTEVYEQKESVRHRHAYRAEREAFDSQGKFSSEVLSNSDCYSSYIEEHRKKNKLKLYIETPDSFIFSSYGLNSEYIK